MHRLLRDAQPGRNKVPHIWGNDKPATKRANIGNARIIENVSPGLYESSSHEEEDNAAQPEAKGEKDGSSSVAMRGRSKRFARVGDTQVERRSSMAPPFPRAAARTSLALEGVVGNEVVKGGAAWKQGPLVVRNRTDKQLEYGAKGCFHINLSFRVPPCWDSVRHDLTPFLFEKLTPMASAHPLQIRTEGIAI